jgi:hypothetical protein
MDRLHSSTLFSEPTSSTCLNRNGDDTPPGDHQRTEDCHGYPRRQACEGRGDDGIGNRLPIAHSSRVAGGSTTSSALGPVVCVPRFWLARRLLQPDGQPTSKVSCSYRYHYRLSRRWQHQSETGISIFVNKMNFAGCSAASEGINTQSRSSFETTSLEDRARATPLLQKGLQRRDSGRHNCPGAPRSSCSSSTPLVSRDKR